MDLGTICNALGSIKTKWFEIGVCLRIPRNKLLEFKGDPDPFSAVVDYWLKENVPESSPRVWMSLVTVLKSDYVGEPGLAEKIRKKYNCQQETTDFEDTNHSSTMADVEMDPVRVDLKAILEKHLKEIMHKFATFVGCLCEGVRKKGVSPGDLRLHLLSLPASTKTREGQMFNLLSDKKEELNKCTEINEIFSFLITECASFLNYDILQSILDRYKVSDDQGVLSSYSRDLKAYVNKHKISEFVIVNPLLKHRKCSKELTLKYDIPTTSRLAKLCELKKFLAEIMDLSPSALEIVDIKDGCVLVTFLIPSFIADSLFTPDTVFTPQQKEKLQANSVLWLKCNGHSFSFKKSGDSIITAAQKLREQLVCSICLGTYTDPKQLQCQHTNCQKCLVGLVQVQQGQSTLTCPTCHEITSVPANGLTGLPTDFRANQLLEILTSVEEMEIVSPTHGDTCIEHGREVELYCRVCDETICYRCVARTERHHTHDYHELSQKKTSQQKLIEKQLTSIKKALKCFDVRHQEISDNSNDTKIAVFSAFSKLQETLNVKKTELITQIDSITQAKIDSLTAQRSDLEIIQAQLRNNLECMRENLRAGNQEEALLTKNTSTTVTSFQPEMLNPKAEPNLIFSGLSDLTAEMCLKYGRVYEANSPDPAKCFITSKGVETAVAGRKTTAILETFDYNGKPCKASVNSKLELENWGISEISNVERTGLSEYEIKYQPTIEGQHQLHITVEGQHIQGSPFPVAAKVPGDEPGTPILTFDRVMTPEGIAVSQNEEVIVTDCHRNCFTVYNSTGKVLRSVGASGSGQGEFKNPYGIAVDNQGNIFVADSGNCRIQKFTAHGEFLASVGALGTGALQFDSPRGITINSCNERLYIAEYGNGRIQILNSDLSHFGVFGVSGNSKGQFNHPQHVTCDSTGNVYITDSDNHRIQVFTAEGEFLRMFGGRGEGSGELYQPYSAAVDNSGFVYVSEPSNNCISVFSKDGQFVRTFGDWGRELGKFCQPRGLIANNSGVLYVCDYKNNRIQAFKFSSYLSLE